MVSALSCAGSRSTQRTCRGYADQGVWSEVWDAWWAVEPTTLMRSSLMVLSRERGRNGRKKSGECSIVNNPSSHPGSNGSGEDHQCQACEGVVLPDGVLRPGWRLVLLEPRECSDSTTSIGQFKLSSVVVIAPRPRKIRKEQQGESIAM